MRTRLTLVVCLAAAAALTAQSPQDRTQPTFRAGANYVRVDMYATRDGESVQDLQASELEVLENGVPTLRGQIEVGANRAQSSAPIDGTLNVWHHFAMSANGVTLSIYWDGQLVGVVDYLGSINATPSIPWLAIGAELIRDPADPNPPQPAPLQPVFVGLMDDIALWNRSQYSSAAW